MTDKFADAIVVVCEFAAVNVCRACSRNCKRLEIGSHSHNGSALRGAIALEALVWSDPPIVGEALAPLLGSQGVVREEEQ